MENEHHNVQGLMEFRGVGESNRLGHEREIRIADLILGTEGVSSVAKSRKYGKNDQLGIDLVVRFNNQSPYHEIGLVYVQVKGSKAEVRRFKRKVEKRYGLAQGDWSAWAKKNKRVILREKSEELVLEDFNAQAQGILDYKRDEEDSSYLLEGYPGF